MFISQSRRFVFIHIVKTAGESVTQLFDQTSLWNDLPIGGTPFGEAVNRHYQNKHGLHKHSTSQEVREILGASDWSQYYTFTFTRHPYSRILSLYNYAARMVDRHRTPYLKRLPRRARRVHDMWSWPAIRAFNETRSFSEFIRHEQFWNDLASKNQTEWVLDDEGKQIVDFIGKVESLDSDLRAITERLALPVCHLDRKNASPVGQNHRNLPTESDYRFLQEAYQKDFKTFDYDPDWRIQTPA